MRHATALAPRPLVPEDRFRPTGPRPAVHLERACFAIAKGHGAMHSVEEIAKELWPDDQVTPLVVRAAVSPATTTGWAASLAATAVAQDFVGSLAPQSAAARLINAAGLRTSLAGIDHVLIPRRQGSVPADGVAWVGEGAPTPVRQFSVGAVQLGPSHKLAAICVLTHELINHSGGEETVRVLLREDVAASLDAALFSALAANTTRPAGLLNGVAPLTPTSGGGNAAMIGDLEALSIALANAGASNPVFVMSSDMAARARLRFTSNERIEIWPTAALAAGTVIGVASEAFVSAFGPEPRIDIATYATVHMEDATPLAIGTAGTPAIVAAPTRSTWQSDSLALRMILDCAWTMRASGMVQYITGATW